MREVVADFDLSKLIAPSPSDQFNDSLTQDPGIDETAHEHTGERLGPQPVERMRPSARAGTMPASARDNENLTLLEARAYMQKIARLLRDSGRISEHEHRSVVRS